MRGIPWPISIVQMLLFYFVLECGLIAMLLTLLFLDRASRGVAQAA